MAERVILLLAFLSFVAQTLCVEHEPSRDTQTWAKTSLPKRLRYYKKEATTHLQFYFHDIVSGRNATAIRVAQGADTNTSATGFGCVAMADDPLTVKPDMASKIVGRAQGLYGCAGQHDVALIMAMSFCFNEGIYNGSCLSVLSRNPALEHIREITVVGGSGMFRMARGYAIAETYSFNNLGDACVGYNVTVVH